jgi:hypothetical protein
MASLDKGSRGKFKGKQEGEHDKEFAKGGNTPMFGKGDRTVTAQADAANEQAPGRTEQHPDSGANPKFAEGGSNKMFGFNPSVPATGGQTGAR